MELTMRWRLGSAMAAAAFLSMASFQPLAHAADAVLPQASETGVDVNRPRLERVDAPRREIIVRAYPRYRVFRPRIIWQVDASSVQPAYILR
jgi:hypothetical protein